MEIIERYEYKFLAPAHLVHEIRTVALTTSRVDRDAGEGGGYKIRSLYFDTPSLDLHMANDREQGRRLKKVASIERALPIDERRSRAELQPLDLVRQHRTALDALRRAAGGPLLSSAKSAAA